MRLCAFSDSFRGFKLVPAKQRYLVQPPLTQAVEQLNANRTKTMPTSFTPQPNENEFECGRCGTFFYHELTRCPNCGVNIYEPEDEEEYDPSETTSVPQGGLFTRVRAFFQQLLGRSHPAEALFKTPQEQITLYNDLLRKVGGDHTTADRLINLEIQRSPNANRIACIKNAIRRWERDNQ